MSQLSQRGRELARERLTPEHFEPLLAKACAQLAEAMQIADAAREFVEQTRQRLHDGALDQPTWLAEALAPFVLAEMVSAVEQALQRGIESRCPYTALRMFVSAGMLAGAGADGLFATGSYPAEPTIRSQLIEEGIGRARQIHHDVAEELEHLPEATRGRVPQFEELKLKLGEGEVG